MKTAGDRSTTPSYECIMKISKEDAQQQVEFEDSEDFEELDEEGKLFYTMLFGTDYDDDVKKEREKNKG